MRGNPTGGTMPTKEIILPVTPSTGSKRPAYDISMFNIEHWNVSLMWHHL
jgi:hypothetical protein